MEKREWKIYKRENKINGKVYIGQTKQYNWKTRLHQEDNGVKYQDKPQYISCAIAKYGVDNFEDSIIDIAHTQEEADEKEIYWISFYNSFETGYNQTRGGAVGSDNGVECWNLSTETKYDSLSSLANSLGATQPHVWSVINRKMPHDGTSCFTQVKKAFVMTDEELQDTFDGSIVDAIEFLQELRNSNKRVRHENAKLRGDLTTIEKFLETIPQERTLTNYDYCQFLIKNTTSMNYYAYCNDDVAELLIDWEEYLSTLEYLISRDERYMEVYRGKIKDISFLDYYKTLNTTFSIEYCSALWNRAFPQKVVDYLLMKEEIQNHIKEELPWKKCNKCNRVYPISLVFYSPNKSSWCGLYSVDRGCRSVKEDIMWHEMYDDIIDELEIDLDNMPVVKNGKEYKKYIEGR